MTRFLITILVALATLTANADCVYRQSDAAEITLGPYVDATDGVTAETGLTISQGDVILKKCAAGGDCGAAAQKNDAGACAHDANGMYECDLNATDLDTVGTLEIWSFESGAAPVFKTCTVLDTAPFDRDYADAATGIIGTAQTGDSFARLGAPAGASIAADIVTLDNFIDTEVADILTDTGTTLDDLVDDLESRLGTPGNLGGGATVAANLSDIEAQTDDIGAAGAGLTAVSSVSVDELTAPALADFFNTDSGTTYASAVAGSVVEEIADNAGGSSFGADDFGIVTTGTAQGGTSTTIQLADATSFANNFLNCATVLITGGTGAGQSNTIETWVSTGDTATMSGAWTTAPSSDSTYNVFGTACGTGGSGLDAAGVRSAIGLASANLDTQLTAIDDAVDTEVAAILVDTGTTLDDLVDDLESRLGTPSNLGGGATLAANASDIEAQTDDIGAAGAGLTAADDAVMTRLGAPAGASIAADIAALVTLITAVDNFIDTEIAAIQAKTDQLTFGVTNTLNTNVEYMNAVEVLGVGTAADPWNGE